MNDPRTFQQAVDELFAALADAFHIPWLVDRLNRVIFVNRPGWFGVRCGRLYLVLKNNRLHRPLYSERNRKRCSHVTVRNWRLRLSWRPTRAPREDPDDQPPRPVS